MRSYTNLYPKICSFPALLAAYLRARKGKHGRHDAAEFHMNLEGNLLNLELELCRFTYQPSQYHNFVITDPKRRVISKADFRDRVVHHLLYGVMEPIYEKKFIFDSYACRVGKGTHRAVHRCQRFMARNRYYIHCDIVKFFPSVDHQILLDLLGRTLRDERFMELVRRILDSGEGVLREEWEPHYFSGDDLFAVLRPKGLPIGNLTSQFWANVYLDGMDHFVKEQLRVRDYLRYADDFVLFGNDNRELADRRTGIEEYAGGLRLRIHRERALVRPTRDGIGFLGFRVFPDRLKLKRENVKRFVKRFRWQRKRLRQGALTIPDVTRSVQGWVAHAQHAQSARLREKVMSGLVIQSQ